MFYDIIKLGRIMEKLDKIKLELEKFNQQVGWGEIEATSASELARLLTDEAIELADEIAKENNLGMDKYDVSLEVADVFIFLQKICIALDIDLLSAVEDKMFINRARFLNDAYREKLKSPLPKAGRLYKIHTMYNDFEYTKHENLIEGQLMGIKNKHGLHQQVIIIDDCQLKSEYLKPIVAIMYPRSEETPVWIASDEYSDAESIAKKLRNIEVIFDLELI